jgi:hypothetical protein
MLEVLEILLLFNVHGHFIHLIWKFFILFSENINFHVIFPNPS